MVAQELEPGAYSAGPVDMNVWFVAQSLSSGDIAFDQSSPIEDADAQIHTTALGYLRSFGLAEKLASISVGIPYALGDLSGKLDGEAQAVERSGLLDPRIRLTMNLRGIPAMAPRDFAQYQPDWVMGVSLVVIPPLGQYDASKLINLGSNRWSFKPELGFTKTLGQWSVEAAAGVWLFTDNTNYRNGGVREQDAIGSYQAHLRYTFRPGNWLAFSANYYTGGRTTINGSTQFDLQENSRTGLTYALPLKRGHALRFTYSFGARTTVGAAFDFFGVSYQFAAPVKRKTIEVDSFSRRRGKL